jgi:hypothetical protein
MALWNSILLAAVGGGLTTLGAWLGFRWQSREAHQLRSEQLVREDRFLLHKERMESYASFFREVGSRSSPRHSPAAPPAVARSRSSVPSPGSPARSACCSAGC